MTARLNLRVRPSLPSAARGRRRPDPSRYPTSSRLHLSGPRRIAAAIQAYTHNALRGQVADQRLALPGREYARRDRRVDIYIEKNKLKDAAFTLHQATERAYICFLLVRTLYFPRWHNIKFLRSLAEDREPRLIDAWPRERRIDRRRFQLLKRAYVEARYSKAYEISVEELNAILECVRTLRDLVEHVSRERLKTLQIAAGM